MHVSEDQQNENVEDETGPAEIESGNKRPRVDPQFDIKIGTKMVAKMVVMHELPLSFVKYFGFRDLMKYCKPLIGPLSKDLLKKEIFKLYDVERTTTRKMMGKIESKIAISVDFVIPHNESSRHMAVTAHYVDDSWALQSRIMRFIHVPFPYTAEMVCDELVELLIDWNLDRKLSALTIDSCSINDAMMSMLIAKFTVDSKVMGGRFFHLQCCAQILDLIMKDGMEVIEKDVEKIRDSISFLISTPERVENFENTAHRLNVAYTKKLLLDSRSMWNSTYLMLSTALEYKDVFIHLKMCDEQFECLPTESEWKMAKAICEHLEVFNELKEMFLKTKYMTAALFLLMLSRIRLSINKWLKSSDDDIKCRATNMMAKFETYWEVVYGVKAMAVVLNPRYKIRFIEVTLLNVSYFLGWKLNMMKGYSDRVEDAIDILAIPLSTIACETIFREGRKLLGPRHRKLQPNTLNAIICTQHWFSKGYIPEDEIDTGSDYDDIFDDFDDNGDDEWL
ncbi:hypothetical protein Patl1_24633 [Pistacia atlantica]|uniref:Uncharacterized protein n=1 Tax=Pistacia atlantica TaxID=434234 RepID=A0ACC0ZWL7_9ROSI|nr:hypothetical protein Patl1_24633 [Pistacia atlantica]